jgi:type IV pilus assembly protein PilC
MTNTSIPNPPPPKKRPLALRLFLGFLFVAAIFLATFYLVSSPHQRNTITQDFLTFNTHAASALCIVIGSALALSAIYLILRFLTISIVRAVEIASAGRLSPAALSWAIAVVLGLWGFVMCVIISIALSVLSDAGFILGLLLWFFFICFNPLALLVAIRYVQAKRQLAARLLLIQAAGLVSAGVDPIRALANVRPHMSYLDARQHAIVQSLRENLTFAEALNRAIPYLTRADKALLLAAQRMGILGPVLTQKSQDIQRQKNPGMTGFASSIVVMEWSFLVTVVLLIMIFVIPKFEKIFEDFGTDLPFATKTLLFTAKYLMGVLPDQPVPGILYLLLAFASIPLFLIIWSFLKGRLARLAVDIQLPILGDLFLRSGMVDVCYFLSHTLRAGIDLPTALAQTRTLVLNPAIKFRLAAWESQLRHGLPPAQAAQLAGLPPVMTAFIRSAQHGPAMGDAMDRLARYYQNQTSRTRIVLESLLMPLTILATGLVIGGVVIALFAPMIKLLAKLT